MLMRVAPVGTVLKGVRMELHDAGLTFGRQIATYPILAGVPLQVGLKTVMDVKVVGHGYRSITAVPHPLDINHAPVKLIESLPGVGKSRAAKIIRSRPFTNDEEFISAMDDPSVARLLADYFEYL